MPDGTALSESLASCRFARIMGTSDWHESFRVAITRLPSASLARCELSFLDRQPIDVDRARAQHATYREALAGAGVEVVVLPALDALPDAVFVEDTTIVLDDIAIVSPMGAPSRRPETAHMTETLRRYRAVCALSAPATLDGGDVLRVGRTLFVGQTARTNRAALDQLTALIEPRGYRVVAVSLSQCLHLKTAGTALGHDRVLINPDWIAPATFDGLDVIAVDPAEPWGANAVAVRDRVVVPANSPRTARRLRDAGMHVVPVDVGELQKAEAGVTCMSVLL
jgi:dimethylargininase